MKNQFTIIILKFYLVLFFTYLFLNGLNSLLDYPDSHSRSTDCSYLSIYYGLLWLVYRMLWPLFRFIDSKKKELRERQEQYKKQIDKYDSWMPFHAQKTKGIHDHMTETEVEEAEGLSNIYSVWFGFAFLNPFLYIMNSSFSSLESFYVVPLIIIHLIALQIWLNTQRKFLCSTEWAKAQGYSADGFKLFNFKIGHNKRRKNKEN
jgi:hypothetical protein